MSALVKAIGQCGSPDSLIFRSAGSGFEGVHRAPREVSPDLLGTSQACVPKPTGNACKPMVLSSRSRGRGEAGTRMTTRAPASPDRRARHGCHAEGRGFESLHPL